MASLYKFGRVFGGVLLSAAWLGGITGLLNIGEFASWSFRDGAISVFFLSGISLALIFGLPKD